jgi:hypothetical protein
LKAANGQKRTRESPVEAVFSKICLLSFFLPEVGNEQRLLRETDAGALAIRLPGRRHKREIARRFNDSQHL